MDKIYYLCDGKACEGCNNENCHHTSKIEHAKNFIKRTTYSDDVVYEEVNKKCNQYKDYFDIKISGQKELQLNIKLKKKYTKAMKKLAKQLKMIAKTMIKLGDFVPEINLKVKDKTAELEMNNESNSN